MKKLFLITFPYGNRKYKRALILFTRFYLSRVKCINVIEIYIRSQHFANNAVEIYRLQIVCRDANMYKNNMIKKKKT